MNLGKYFNIESPKTDSKLREILIIAAFAVILLGFGNGFSGRYGFYEGDDGFEGLQDPESGRSSISNKKRHRHRRRGIDEKVRRGTALVEDNMEPENHINSDEVPYIIE